MGIALVQLDNGLVVTHVKVFKIGIVLGEMRGIQTIPRIVSGIPRGKLVIASYCNLHHSYRSYRLDIVQREWRSTLGHDRSDMRGRRDVILKVSSRGCLKLSLVFFFTTNASGPSVSVGKIAMKRRVLGNRLTRRPLVEILGSFESAPSHSWHQIAGI